MLEIYARAFDTVEVDSTFYAVPSTATVEAWEKKVGRGFTFSLKLPRIITHEYALRNGSAELLKEFCQRVRLLNEKLAAVLIQLPPQFEMNTENARALRDFLPHLPRDIRFSIEFRSGGWIEQRVIDKLAEYNVSVALVEGQWIARPRVWYIAEMLTADFAYVRWMGARNLTRFDTVQRPQEENLLAWREVISNLCERVPRTYVYFSNFYEGHAPASANKLKQLLGQRTVTATDLEDQPSLF